MNAKKYIVYRHISPSNKVYIGITCQVPQKRWSNGLGYINNTHFYKAIQKYGWNNFKHEILIDNLTLEEAKAIEIELIKKYNSNDNLYGYNKTAGGDCRLPLSDETKLKLSLAKRGKPKSEETRVRMSIGDKNKPKRHLSEIHKQNISKSLVGNTRAKGITTNKIKVDRYTLDYKYIDSFQSAKAAGAFMNCSSSGINRACKENLMYNDLSKTKYKGKYKGYIWKYDLTNFNTKRKPYYIALQNATLNLL